MEKALLGLVAGMVGVLIWVIKRRNGHGKSNGTPTVAQLSLVHNMEEHMDAMERRLHERLDRMQSDLLMAAREVALALKETQTKGKP